MPPGPVIQAKFHHQTATTDTRHVFAQKFAELADSRTRGRLKIEVIPAGQLYQGKSEDDALAKGEIQFAVPRLADLTVLDSIWRVIDLPFLVTPAVAARLGTNEVSRRLWQKTAQQGILGLGLIDLQDPVLLFTKDRPLQSLDDLKGMRIRTYLTEPGPHEAWLNLFGAKVIALSGNEVYPALQRGQIDAVLTTVTAASDLRLPEVLKYGNQLPISAVPMGFATNSRWYNGLPSEIRHAIADDILPETLDYLRAYLNRYVAERRDKAARDGIQFVDPPPGLMTAWPKRTADELYPRYADEFPPDLIRQIQALQ